MIATVPTHIYMAFYTSAKHLISVSHFTFSKSWAGPLVLCTFGIQDAETQRSYFAQEHTTTESYSGFGIQVPRWIILCLHTFHNSATCQALVTGVTEKELSLSKCTLQSNGVRNRHYMDICIYVCMNNYIIICNKGCGKKAEFCENAWPRNLT